MFLVRVCFTYMKCTVFIVEFYIQGHLKFIFKYFVANEMIHIEFEDELKTALNIIYDCKYWAIIIITNSIKRIKLTKKLKKSALDNIYNI